MILYHGSNTDFDKIELSKCIPNKDFGRGFYLTPSKVDAAKRAGHQVNRVDKLVHIVGLYTEGEGVDIAEGLEKHTLALHNGHTCLRAYVAESEYCASVSNY